MATHKIRQSSSYDLPATYQISVQGRIDPSWSARLEGMQISIDTSQDAATTTTLVGELSDQAALAGVLNTIYTLHLTVIEVRRLETPAAERADHTSTWHVSPNEEEAL